MTIRTRQELLNSINTLLADNSSQQISPLDVRSSLIDTIDSLANLLTTVEVNAINMSTPDDRTVKVGVGALDKLDLVGRSSADNTAVGYRTLFQNYDGVDNTAVGSQALSCNLYGDHLVAIGKNALAGNISGSGSVALGNFAGQALKTGNFNIFIGHGAGNYVPTGQDYRLYIGAHAVNYTDLCDSESASGNAPTMYGDLENHKLAIGVGSLHDFGALQVSGDVSPVTNDASNLGHGSKGWDQLWLTSGIAYANSGTFVISSHAPKGGGFPDQYTLTPRIYMDGGGKIGIGTQTPSGSQGIMTVAGNIVPSVNGTYQLGAPDLKWDGYFNDVVISGNATIVDLDYDTRVDYLYEPMTIHLAVSGTADPLSSGFVNNAVYGYLSDPELNGAGWMLHSSGNDYQRDYQFIFYEPDQSLNCLETDSNYARSHWTSNISLKVADGRHVQTQRVLSGDENLSLVTQSGCHGLFLRTDVTATSGQYTVLGSEDHVTAAYSNRKNVNFYANSGEQNYFLGVHSINSGVTLGIDFATSVGSTPSGFSLEYVNRIAGDDTFVIKRNASSKDILTVMESGFVGISNANSVAVIPETNLHVQSTVAAEARISSAGTDAMLTLERKDQNKGLRVAYDAGDAMIDFMAVSGSDVRDYDQWAFMTVQPTTRYVTIGQVHGPTNTSRPFNDIAPLAIYHTGSLSGTLALAEQTDTPNNSAGFGKVYVKPNVSAGQTQSIYFVDDGGNVFDLTTGGNEDGLHYTYPGSTVVGSGGFGQISNNRFTTAVGVGAFSSGTTITSGVLLGFNNAQYTTSSPTGPILIGTSLYRNTTLPSYTLAIGHGTSPLVTGNTSSREFWVSNGTLGATSTNDATAFSISHTLSEGYYNTHINHKDTTNASSVSGLMKFNFIDSSDSSNTLMTLDHRSDAMSNSVSFSGGNPFMRLDGDLKVRGSIQFSDGSYFESAVGVLTYAGSGMQRRTASYGAILDINMRNLNRTTASYVGDLSNVDLMIADSNALHLRMSLSDLTQYINSGSAFIANNCNHVFLYDVNTFNPALNSGNVVIGCDAAHSATGWKHSVMIGTEAGSGATTPNVVFATDNGSVMVGYRAGRDADNVGNLIAIGTNAANKARNAEGSIYIGQSAGSHVQCTNSIGIGENALRGTDGGGLGGDKNIEIVAGMLDSQRLMYQKGNLSERLNIANTIAGHMGNRRVSIGDAVLAPDAPLSVRRDSTIPGHSGTDNIQTWHCNDTKVAQVDCDGEFESINYPMVIEGFTAAQISCPSGYQWPTSGILVVRGEDFISTREVYITHRDPSRTIAAGVFSLAIRVNKEYRPFNPGCSGV